MKQRTATFRAIEKLLSALLLFAILLSGLGYFELPRPVDIKDIDPMVLNEPVQKGIPVHPFKFPYAGTTYVIEPLATYQIAGLVVSHNDTSSIADAYHDSSSVDVKDLCVVWGDNASPRVLKDVDFRSEPWTCFADFKNEQGEISFQPDQLSNNHLLASTADIRRTIKSVHIGDQVLMRGRLVNYYDERFPDAVRKTSLVRTDTGDGACEVLFVEEIKILSRAAPWWRKIFDGGKVAVMVLTALRILAFLLFPYLEFRSGV